MNSGQVGWYEWSVVVIECVFGSEFVSHCPCLCVHMEIASVFTVRIYFLCVVGDSSLSSVNVVLRIGRTWWRMSVIQPDGGRGAEFPTVV